MPPRISVCLIARDEAEMLPGCLDAARGVFDELVLVDTGSTDDTVAIARARGAVVGHFDWIDDFAAARNAALDLATGDFVLSLDADERLVAGAVDAIRAAVATDRLDCGLLPYHSPKTLDAPVDRVLTGELAAFPASLVARLARRTPDLRWESRVHESWSTWLRRPGLRVATVDAPLLHLGAAPEWRAPRGRSDRNLRLLELEVADHPHDVGARAYLAMELSERGRGAEAAAVAADAWRIVRRQVARSGRPAQPGAAVPAVSVFGWYAVKDGRFEEAREAAEALLGAGSQHPNLTWLSGVAHENLAVRAQGRARAAHLSAARDAYQRTLAVEGRLFTQVVFAEAKGPLLRRRLGTVLLQVGALDAAERCFAEAQAADPGDALAALGRAEVALERGHGAIALRLVEPLLGGETADAWILAAAAAWGSDRTTGRALLRQALARVRTSLVELHRLARLNAMLVEVDGRP